MGQRGTGVAGRRMPERWSEAVRERRGDGRVLLRTAGLGIVDVHCCEDRTGFAGPGCEDMYGVVLTRAGSYLRRVNGEEFFVDSTGGYVMCPGDEHLIAHPVGPGDRSTILQCDRDLFNDLFVERSSRRHVLVDGVTDLRHRALVAAARRGADPFELAERAHVLLDAVAGAASQEAAGRPQRTASLRTAALRTTTQRAHRRIAADACAVLAARTAYPPVPALGELAREIGVSPHHLSRVFRAVTGRTLTAYRNALRVRAVLQAIEEGQWGLRALAATHGFADQAHLTRVMRQYTGSLPSAVREQLAPYGGQLATRPDRARIFNAGR
ncbi:helix-turn-helix transcriptional regulator [Streptomyces sp. NPDC051561]|uniref:helix-turn-helix transcriptional regulator n=1 Tax=Streptomyces sp. NPDC051561 TaxID=3365658 RepID=UPI0037A6C611